LFERPAPEGEPGYWDQPDPLLPAHLDTFSLFAMNETTISQMQRMGWEEEHVDQVRASMDSVYVRYREELAEQYMSYPAHLRAHQWFMRDYLPAIQFWPDGGVLDSSHPR
jgi:hypothetical protein